MLAWAITKAGRDLSTRIIITRDYNFTLTPNIRADRLAMFRPLLSYQPAGRLRLVPGLAIPQQEGILRHLLHHRVFVTAP